ncbi:MAG: glycoside hydrolase family 65 protein, partial [Acetobacteraceae bacterium]
FEPAREGKRETLLATGNGYFVTRGAAAEARADGIHYPGTYLAGGYNRLVTSVEGRLVENEDLVNLPNWLGLTFRIDDGAWFTPRQAEILSYRRALDLGRGVHEYRSRVRDSSGRVTRITERRLVHMRDKHIAAQQMEIAAENWCGRLTVRAELDGRIVNAGVLRYLPFDGAHLDVRDVAERGSEMILLEAEAKQSRLGITEAARIRVMTDPPSGAAERKLVTEPGRIGHEIAVELGAEGRACVEKVVALYTSRDHAVADGATEARTALERAGTFEDLLRVHALTWRQLWRRCDMNVDEADGNRDINRIVRLHIFHLLQTVSHHAVDLDAGVPARGWHGEGYRGHIFWDELFVFPFLNLRLPMLTRALLLYRYRRLPEARWAAREAGYAGAMFPWQSGSNGREETDARFLNPRSRNWIEDHTHIQRHVGAAVAYNVWQYYLATGDGEFLNSHGAELLFEIARFWASAARWNETRCRYEIHGVMGPDEFHDRYPGQRQAGLNNNAYTNVMAAWCLARALELFRILPDERCRELREMLDLGDAEIERWDRVSRKLYVPFHADGIVSQFEGYDELREFDWPAYRRSYGNVMRLDLILEAEGDSPNHYKLSKQADVLMLFYLFSAEELGEVFARLGYGFDPAAIPRIVDYYLRRTSHGSTLSRVVHAWVLARCCRDRSWPLFTEALHSDIDDIQGGTTLEGIHLGAMAGTVDLLQRCFTGLELRGNELRFHPMLPDELKRLSFRMTYHRHALRVEVTPAALSIASDQSDAEPITVVVDDRTLVLPAGSQRSVALGAAGPERAPRQVLQL